MKNKLMLGISIFIVSVTMMILGGLIFNTVPNTDTLMIKDGFKLFGSFMLMAMGLFGITIGFVFIGTTFDE